MPKPPPKLRLLATALILFSILALIAAYLETDLSERTIQVNGLTRRYLFYEPDQVEGKLPLLLVFHGFSGTAEGTRESSHLHELVNEHQFFLAYLDGDPTWHTAIPGRPNVDVDFFDQLCDQLEKHNPIDPDRIYVAGMSMGGDFAIRLAGLRSERIAAVASQGMITPGAVDAQRSFPLLVIVGTEDDRVSSERISTVTAAFRDRGHEVEVIRPEGVGHRWHEPLNERLWKFLMGHRLESVE